MRSPCQRRHRDLATDVCASPRPGPLAGRIIWGVGEADGHEFIDVGGGARLESFGGRLIDRPSPGALGMRGRPEAWADADLRFDRDSGWSGPSSPSEPWLANFAGLTLEMRTTEAGQVGLFPEHAALLGWLQDRVGAASDTPTILNLFAYTGLATLALAAEGAAVTHVDASRPTIAWARRNAELSGLADRPIRWILDDARAFVTRENRRGRRYAGVILDPPSYGHGPGSGAWQIATDLPDLLAACAAILDRDGFVVLTAHTPAFDRGHLADLVGKALRRPATAIEGGDLTLETVDGRQLELGAFARSPGGA
jgi:23S rRNA (cytosine1962-C5)-methyltransferase